MKQVRFHQYHIVCQKRLNTHQKCIHIFCLGSRMSAASFWKDELKGHCAYLIVKWIPVAGIRKQVVTWSLASQWMEPRT